MHRCENDFYDVLFVRDGESKRVHAEDLNAFNISDYEADYAHILLSACHGEGESIVEKLGLTKKSKETCRRHFAVP